MRQPWHFIRTARPNALREYNRANAVLRLSEVLASAHPTAASDNLPLMWDAEALPPIRALAGPNVHQLMQLSLPANPTYRGSC